MILACYLKSLFLRVFLFNDLKVRTRTVSPDIAFYFEVYKFKSVPFVTPLMVFKFVRLSVAHGPAPYEDPPCGLHMWCVYTHIYM